MRPLNFCVDGGYLVGMMYPLASDASEFYVKGLACIVGCTRLRCAVCHTEVRAEPSWKPGSVDEGRYQCNCTDDLSKGVWVERSAKYLEYDRDEYPLPWSCEGHPVVELPFKLDGVRIDRTTDIPALVARALEGWAPPAARSIERDTPAGWVVKLWARLTGSGLEGDVARAVGACLGSTEPRIRASALRFFDAVGDVPGAELIEDLAETCDRDPLDAVTDPTYPSSTVTLGKAVRMALGGRIRRLRDAGRDVARALRIAERLIVQPGRAGGLVTVVSEADWPWFERHAEAIVRTTPEVCAEVLMSFPEPDEAGGLATRLASIAGIDVDELTLWAESSLSEDALATLRAALGARAI